MTANKLFWSIESLWNKAQLQQEYIISKKSGSNSLQKRKVWKVLKPEGSK